MLEFTPDARNVLQRMPANDASELSKHAEKVAVALNRKVIGKEVLEIAALVDDETLDEMLFNQEQAYEATHRT